MGINASSKNESGINTYSQQLYSGNIRVNPNLNGQVYTKINPVTEEIEFTDHDPRKLSLDLNQLTSEQKILLYKSLSIDHFKIDDSVLNEIKTIERTNTAVYVTYKDGREVKYLGDFIDGFQVEQIRQKDNAIYLVELLKFFDDKGIKIGDIDNFSFIGDDFIKIVSGDDVYFEYYDGVIDRFDREYDSIFEVHGNNIDVSQLSSKEKEILNRNLDFVDINNVSNISGYPRVKVTFDDGTSMEYSSSGYLVTIRGRDADQTANFPEVYDAIFKAYDSQKIGNIQKIDFKNSNEFSLEDDKYHFDFTQGEERYLSVKRYDKGQYNVSKDLEGKFH